MFLTCGHFDGNLNIVFSRSRNTLLNGDTKHYDWDSGYTCHQLGSGSILIQLGELINFFNLYLWRVWFSVAVLRDECKCKVDWIDFKVVFYFLKYSKEVCLIFSWENFHEGRVQLLSFEAVEKVDNVCSSVVGPFSDATSYFWLKHLSITF